jgi:hypothetical protein
MAEVLVEFTEPLALSDGSRYVARVCGGEMDSGLWHGWIEFVPVEGGAVLRSGRETTQPNRADAVYWASGLSRVYLEGALERTLRPHAPRPARTLEPPFYDGPADAPPSGDRRTESILNPFSVYRKGEALLRDQLDALSAWHLVNIIRDYGLSRLPADDLNALSKGDLIAVIVSAVREESVQP